MPGRGHSVGKRMKLWKFPVGLGSQLSRTALFSKSSHQTHIVTSALNVTVKYFMILNT